MDIQFLWPLGLFAALGVVAASNAQAEPRVVTLGTATPGGGFPVYGQAVAETINAVDPSLRVETRNTKGSTENVPMLEAGQLDIALVQGEVAHEVLERDRTAAGEPADHHRDVRDAGHVRGARRHAVPHHRGPQGQAGRVRRARARASSSWPATSSTGSGSTAIATSRPSSWIRPETARRW